MTMAVQTRTEKQTHDIQYLKANAGDIPVAVRTSTARKGRKWFDKCQPNDNLVLRYTEDNAQFGRATVATVELVTYAEVLKRSAENHAGENVAAALEAAYGKSEPTDEFTIIGFHRLTDLPAEEAKVEA